MSKKQKPKLNPPDTAPKDGTVFLADLGYPWMCYAVWNPSMSNYAYAQLELGNFEGENDYYFIGESADKSELLGWLPMPELYPTPKKRGTFDAGKIMKIRIKGGFVRDPKTLFETNKNNSSPNEHSA